MKAQRSEQEGWGRWGGAGGWGLGSASSGGVNSHGLIMVGHLSTSEPTGLQSGSGMRDDGHLEK